MIQRMDRIYANASLTIVAASGEEANTGLPGVSKFHRKQRQEVHADQITLVTVPDGYHDLANSSWATRGWTYQEGYFSPRRLIFTSEQVLFLCNEMYLSESMSCRNPWSLTIPGKVLDFISNYNMDFDDEMDSQPPWQQIEHYSRSYLSYPRDALIAFLGVFNHFESDVAKKSGYQISHIQGIPVVITSEDSLEVYLTFFRLGARKTMT